MDDVPSRLDFDRATRVSFRAGTADVGARLDLALAKRLEGLSRAFAQRLIRMGAVTVNGAAARAATRLHSGDAVEAGVPEILPPCAEPEDLPLEVLREEETFLVIAKPPGMAVHPGSGRPGGTLANALAFHYGLERAGGEAYRPGIVHRLDLETSGVMVVARTAAAHAALSDAFRERRVEKTYLALVHGAPEHDEDRIDLPLGRDLRDAQKRAVRFDDAGRAALTDVEVRERFEESAALVECRPKTGRTHQIRVHLKQRGHPILGDRTYARRRKPPVPVPRLMLHAARLVFPHPGSGEPVAAAADPPADFAGVLAALRALAAG